MILVDIFLALWFDEFEFSVGVEMHEIFIKISMQTKDIIRVLQFTFHSDFKSIIPKATQFHFD